MKDILQQMVMEVAKHIQQHPEKVEYELRLDPLRDEPRYITYTFRIPVEQ